MDNHKDPNLQVPQEANTEKHINFREVEENETGNIPPAESDDNSPTKKAWDELREETRKNND